MASPLTIEDRGPARVVTIDRPEVLNALDPSVLEALLEAVADARQTASVAGLVLTGAGSKAFVAGADIAAMRSMTAAQALAFAEAGHALGDALQHAPIVTIAAVGGFALGGGCELALACDFAYAGPKAKFGQPEVKLGVIPGFGGTQRLTRRVGTAASLELCLTGKVIDAAEALRIGLVNLVVDDPVAAAVHTVETVAAMGPAAVARAKEVIYTGASLPLREANHHERAAFAALFGTKEQEEGMSAFLDKRTPRFTRG